MAESKIHQYWHGTRWAFKPGDTVTPRSVNNAGPSSAPVGSGWKEARDAADFVYVTTDRRAAWAYALNASGDGVPAVYLVLPARGIEHDPDHRAVLPAYRCMSATVLDYDRGEPLTAEQAAALWVPENPNERAIRNVEREPERE